MLSINPANLVLNNSLPILLFHALDNSSFNIAFSPKSFEKAISKLYLSGYQTLNLSTIPNYLQENKTFPKNSFVITFDDGYRSVYEQAFPVLQKYNFTATIFITTGKTKPLTTLERLPSIQGRTMLSWHEIKLMQAANISIGSHTLTHPNLTKLPKKELVAEIYESKAMIEDILGTEINSFAYPYGYYDKTSLELVQKYYSCACSTNLGLVQSTSNLYLLERVETYYLRQEKLFNLMMTNELLSIYLQLRNIPRKIRQTFLPHFL
ncbi:MAG: polysaccharide deacetylase family protein [Blastocatellia bacterium]|nr:polysaccharide deacetylase family protein [Blastocatellia bacterium]MBL8194216.1 polysaccharide deacetylase family protein [Blastocatellia bacterium]MBN8724028.1 polysaccharide deacetylase family protein [Acidobacteriota bacterium]